MSPAECRDEKTRHKKDAELSTEHFLVHSTILQRSHQPAASPYESYPTQDHETPKLDYLLSKLMRPGSPQTPNFECSNNLLMSGLISVAIRVRDLDQEQHLLGCSCELAEDKYKCQTLQSGSYTEKSPVDRLVREHGMAWRRPGQAYLIDSLIFQSHYYSTAADILSTPLLQLHYYLAVDRNLCAEPEDRRAPHIRRSESSISIAVVTPKTIAPPQYLAS
ncbi:hypothetical protein GW17_00048151 [Ensete ventricosum]|nr:hypothetical protein GW17_00048151 [Ensete ventricosum]